MMYTMPKNLLSICVNFALATQPGHENSKTTMDIYAKVKYNKPEELSSVVNAAFGLR